MANTILVIAVAATGERQVAHGGRAKFSVEAMRVLMIVDFMRIGVVAHGSAVLGFGPERLLRNISRRSRPMGPIVLMVRGRPGEA
jgi:hypothetical protein